MSNELLEVLELLRFVSQTGNCAESAVSINVCDKVLGTVYARGRKWAHEVAYDEFTRSGLMVCGIQERSF
ncbi:hypothetical protein B5P42_31215 [Bacillus sp. SRB_331]|nr:hypothetical protein B5P42_31215 [Bacillus sp. SRB_331]